MKKLLSLTFFIYLSVSTLSAQTIYEFSFTVPGTVGPVACKAMFIDQHDGKGNLRIKFVSPAGKDTVLADLSITEVYPDMNSGCFKSGWFCYKLQNPRYIESMDPGFILPACVFFKTDPATANAEPIGVSGTTDCNGEIQRFSSVSLLGQKDLTKELVLTYFKPYEPFYRNLFVTNNSKALSVEERGIKLFLLFVANTTDAKIGTTDRKNMNEAIAFFGKIKNTLGIDQFLYDTLAGNDFTRKNVENKIKTFLTPGPKDIVVFYYSGHGFRKEKDGRPGPWMDLTLDYKKQKYLDNAMSLEDMVVTIKNKGARLNLILSDACNATVNDTNPMVDAIAIGGKKGGLGDYWSTQNARDLFLNATPTTIMASAASPTQLAISNPVFGGYFSTLFRNALSAHLSYTKNKVNWEQIFDQTKAETERMASRTWCNEAKTVKCNNQRPYVSFLYGRF